MDKLAKIQKGIHKEAVDEENNRDRRIMLRRIRNQVTSWGEVVEQATQVSKAELSKIASLIIAFNTTLNKTINNYVKASNSDLLNLDITALESKYNDIVLYLQNIDYSTKDDGDKLKINNAFDELIKPLQSLKNRFDGDPDLSQNEKITVATIISNIMAHNYAPIGAYNRIDNITRREINEGIQNRRLAEKLAYKEEMRRHLMNTADFTELNNDALQRLNDEIGQIKDASLASANHLYDINENTDNIKRTGITTAANTQGINDRLDESNDTQRDIRNATRATSFNTFNTNEGVAEANRNLARTNVRLSRINNDLETIGVDVNNIRGNTETSADNSHKLVDNTQSLIREAENANRELERVSNNVGHIGVDVMAVRDLNEKLDERIQAIQDRLEDLQDIKASSIANTTTGENTSRQVAQVNVAMATLQKELVKLQKQQEKISEYTAQISDNTRPAESAPRVARASEAVVPARAAEAARAEEVVPEIPADTYETVTKISADLASLRRTAKNPERNALLKQAREEFSRARNLLGVRDTKQEGLAILKDVLEMIHNIKRMKVEK